MRGLLACLKHVDVCRVAVFADSESGGADTSARDNYTEEYTHTVVDNLLVHT